VEELDERSAPTVDAHGIRPPPAYAIEDRPPIGATAVLALRGELDMASAPELRAGLEAPSGALALVVDLSEVRFIDSAVLKELLRARDELAGRGIRLVLAGTSHPVQRLLDLTRTSELFEHTPDVETGVALAGGR
jgi:anti-sigma B factor antagonist